VTDAPHRLFVSIHDVSPAFEREVDQLAERLIRRWGSARMTMLVVPDHWDRAPIRPGSPFAGRLRHWRELGIEMFLHGWNHRDDKVHHGFAAFKARHMTAGEGEFLGLGEAEARLRLVRGKKLIEDITGEPVLGFVAPAWLYSKGSRVALRETGFQIAEDHMRVWSPAARDAVLAQGPVITWASRSRARRASSLLAAHLLRATLKNHPDVRIGLHPGDVTSTRLIANIDRTLAHFDRHIPSRYADLLISGCQACA
jgi:uncharacterized protein